MSTRTACGRCGRQLVIVNESATSLTCPHCLARIANPHRVQVSRPAGSVREAERCLDCDAPLQPGWRYCPGCNAPTRPAEGQSRRRDALDIDVRRDSAGTVVALCFLALLLVAGIITFFASPGAATLRADAFGSGLGLFFVVLAAGVACLIFVGRTTTAKTVFTTLGMVLMAVVLVVFAICAGIVDFLQTCKAWH